MAEVVQDWMESKNLFEVPGLPHLFIERDKHGNKVLEVAKVVDEFLIIGPRKNIAHFHAAME